MKVFQYWIESYIDIHENEKKYLNNKWMCMGSPYNLYTENHMYSMFSIHIWTSVCLVI